MPARKSRRAAASKAISYVTKDESSEDETVDPALKEAEAKLKKMVDQDSDAESDFESEILKENKNPEQSSEEDETSDTEEKIKQEAMMNNFGSGRKRKSPSSSLGGPESKINFGGLKALSRGPHSSISRSKKSSLGGLKNKLKTAGHSSSQEPVAAPSLIVVKKELDLSGSESSDDEISERRKRIDQGMQGSSRIDFRSSSFEDDKKDEEEAKDDVQSSQTLIALAQNLDRLQTTWSAKEGVATPERNKEKGKRTKGTIVKNSSDDFDLDSITKLLAAGENVDDYSDDEEDEDEEGKEEEAQHVLPKEGIQINIALPDKYKRKKKKGFDVAAFLKRELSKARRETQALVHQAHFVSLVAHLRYLNDLLTDEVLYGSALSILPQAHHHAPHNVTILKLNSLVKWLREFIPVNKTSFESTTSQSLKTRLCRVLETFLAMDHMELVTMFVLICRAIGLDTRIVLNFDVTPLKPPADDAVSAILETTLEKETAKSPKKKIAASDSEGELGDFEKKTSKNSKSLSSKLSDASKRKSTESLSAKLSEASKRKSSRMTKASTSNAKDREETMIKDIDKKYPTQKEEKKDILAKGKKRKSEETAGPSRPKPKSSKPSKQGDRSLNYWAEVYLEKERKWISVDLVSGRINAPSEIESRLPKPIFYIVTINNMGLMKDVTKRYVVNYMTTTRKIRFDEAWVHSTINKYNKQSDEKESKEDLELVKKSEEAPMPTTVSGFKSHPLYVLERHLLKFEAIYPPEAPPIGWMRKEPVYARECVYTLQGRTSWLKEGRCVRIGQEPYKIVKARPKWDKMAGAMTKDEPLEVFGHWQTELYIPPPAVDGKVPRNEFGNVELFKPWMLPKGCVQIPINGMSRVLRKLNIDAAPAMVGWDFSGRGCHPVFDGYVVCEDFADVVMDAWNQEQEIKLEKENEKREKRVFDNWRRVIKGLLIRQRIQAKYMQKPE